MLSQLILSLTILSSVFAATYHNTSTSFPTATRITLEPTYSVLPTLNTYTYSDDTTTFYVTSTMFTTIWYTPSSTISTTPTTTSIDNVVSTAVSELTSTIEDAHTTYTTTMTSTLLITLSDLYETTTTSIPSVVTQNGQVYKVSNQDKEVVSNVNDADVCSPVTQYITVTTTADANVNEKTVTQFVTKVQDPVTHYVTLQTSTLQPSNGTLFNSTKNV
ncbi:Svs1p NDAI_0K01300 [Naumovozyma dairenensis CBS 421]|uniref:Uncharacterized protein n=1 Tax=Naumovozyma dairenensis (strain ATCC 10597 / BCRC 20456 / CBS 421 / NBRC 0211 / NRRL Y-12639) TaxID=1071378 RepID=G0WHR0_NAUDC|nr:hypothetical protein NDAI_0K01300 [Naumovozyma dairenensis CBS 421]CCD27321.1 hypothetical protein NDAI_0K01300 [Naumovozyma dairenensis CBS 421]